MSKAENGTVAPKSNQPYDVDEAFKKYKASNKSRGLFTPERSSENYVKKLVLRYLSGDITKYILWKVVNDLYPNSVADVFSEGVGEKITKGEIEEFRLQRAQDMKAMIGKRETEKQLNDVIQANKILLDRVDELDKKLKSALEPKNNTIK